jgi:hypothetical protein
MPVRAAGTYPDIPRKDPPHMSRAKATVLYLSTLALIIGFLILFAQLGAARAALHDPQNPRLSDIVHCQTAEGVSTTYPCQWECAVDGPGTCTDGQPVIAIYGQRPWPDPARRTR